MSRLPVAWCWRRGETERGQPCRRNLRTVAARRLRRRVMDFDGASRKGKVDAVARARAAREQRERVSACRPTSRISTRPLWLANCKVVPGAFSLSCGLGHCCVQSGDVHPRPPMVSSLLFASGSCVSSTLCMMASPFVHFAEQWLQV